MNLKVEKNHGLVQVANSQVELVSQELVTRIELKNKVLPMRIRVLSSLPVPFVLGLDFLKNFRIKIGFENRQLCFKDNSDKAYDFEVEESINDTSCGFSKLTSSQAQILKEFLENELPKDTGKPGQTTLKEHVIDVGNHPPIKQRHYLVSPKVLESMVAEVDAMLADDIIEPSKSGWSSPVVMVKKPDKNYTFCLDFRKLNQLTTKDAYPLPQMSGILDT